jgi:flagellar hook-basal body complex protein FliE
MAINATGAISAYRQVASSAGQPGMEARSAVPGKSFKELITDVSNSMLDAGAKSEQMTAQAMTGKADLNEVVMAVANADVALQTVVAVRDRVIQAYQDILRMPI